MKRWAVVIVGALFLGYGSAAVYAAATQQALAPGNTLRVTCTTTLTGTVSSTAADLSCAPLPPALVWKVPAVIGIGQSAGYDPGTSPAIMAFGCQGWWLGNDDDDVFWVVRFPQPTQIHGFRYGTLATSGAHGGYENHTDFRATSSLVKHDELPAVPAPFLQIVQPLPDNVLTQIERTFPPVTVTVLRMDMFNVGSWTNMVKLRILTPPSTPGTVC